MNFIRTSTNPFYYDSWLENMIIDPTFVKSIYRTIKY